jgi:hypothetical protein
VGRGLDTMMPDRRCRGPCAQPTVRRIAGPRIPSDADACRLLGDVVDPVTAAH